MHLLLVSCTLNPQYQSILGVLLRAKYNHILIIIQLLLRVGSTQPKPMGLGYAIRIISGIVKSNEGKARGHGKW